MIIRKLTKLLFAAALILAICAPVSFAQGEQGERIALTVGGERFNEMEIVRIIIDSMSGNEMMAMFMLSQATLDERRQIVSDLSEAILFAEGAKDEGLHLRPETAIKIRWQVARILIEAYFENVSGKWDFSDAAAKKYYNAHRADYVQSEAVWAEYIITETESQALMAALMASGGEGWEQAVKTFSLDANSKTDDRSIGWVEKGVTPPEIEAAIMNGRPGQIVGPVQSEYAWHVILVGERRPARQLTFEEAQQAVMDAMETDYIETLMAIIRKKHPVEINDDVLRTLGGINAPSEAPAE